VIMRRMTILEVAVVVVIVVIVLIYSVLLTIQLFTYPSVSLAISVIITFIL